MNKKGMTGLVAIIFTIAFCGAFYYYQIHGTTSNNTPVTEIADINTTASASKVISYYFYDSGDWSKIVRWNIASDQDPTTEDVISMTTLEELIKGE